MFNSQYPPQTQMAMCQPLIVQPQPSPVFNQPQFHSFPTFDEQSSPVSSLGLPLMVCDPATMHHTTNTAPPTSSTSTDETLSNVSSIQGGIPPFQNTILTPTVFPYNSQGVTMSPVSGGLCTPVVSVDSLQTAWLSPGANMAYMPPQPQIYSQPPPAAFVPYSQPVFAPTPPPTHFELPFDNSFQTRQTPPVETKNAQEPIFSSPQSILPHEPDHTRKSFKFNKLRKKRFPEENDTESALCRRSVSKKKIGCTPVNKSRKNFRVRCKACSAPVSRQVVKDVKPEDLESAFADQNEILDQLPEFFGEPLLNFPEIVFYMQIFSAKSKENDQLQYFKVPRPAKERELHIDHRLTELFIRNFGFDHACEHHEFKRQPVHVHGICHARNLYRQLIVDSLLPTFLAYVRNMDEAKRLFGIIFRYVGCATPKDIASNIPQVWTAVTKVDEDTSLEITGIVSLYNYHLFRRLIERE